MGKILTKEHKGNIKKWREATYKALYSLNVFVSTQGESGGIDSYCFICTHKHFEDFIKLYNPMPYAPSSEGRFFTSKDRAKAKDRGVDIKGYKIGGIRIVTYSTSNLFEDMRGKHKRLDYRLIVELHGFNQYLKNGEKKKVSPQAYEVGIYFLKTPRFSKLKAFDYAIDFKEKMQINYQEAIKKISTLQKLDMPYTQTYKTTLYLQKHAPKFGYQEPLCSFENGALQRVCIYDKQCKNKLDNPLTRFEFRVLLNK